MAKKVLIADDHQLFREGLRGILSKESDFKVVAEAENGRQVVKMVQTEQPEIIIMDISMPELNGIQATKQILTDHPAIKIIALSMHSDRHYVAGMLEAGAQGYLLKDCAGRDLLQALREVLMDRVYISPEITGVVVQDYVSKLSAAPAGGDELSEREKEVLQLIAEGKTTKEISGILFISVKTVETHRARIMEKLNLRSIPELTKYAIRAGLTSLE